MSENNKYWVIRNNEYQMMGLFELVKHQHRQEPRPMVWSARLATGLLGYTNCESGKRGPKGHSEVLLAVGDSGLQKLVELGFITCPECMPEHQEGFWDVVGETVEKIYGIDTLEDFVDKEKMPFDARRVNWEVLMTVIGKAPGRIYVPKGLGVAEVSDFKRFFNDTGVAVPPVGWYNPNNRAGFTEY
ncbi:hypothetical protein KY349_01985 [Candidatus Woesearchaeota archaeon]|nr:hypothetical protein [Candidatus Woesearchaeota archaeon]